MRIKDEYHSSSIGHPNFSNPTVLENLDPIHGLYSSKQDDETGPWKALVEASVERCRNFGKKTPNDSVERGRKTRFFGILGPEDSDQLCRKIREDEAG